MRDLRDRFAGSLLGTALGDALGASGWGRAIARQGAADVDEAQPPGILFYTDDTHMAIGVAESLIERRGLDVDHMAARFAEDYEREPYRGYGPGPPRIFRMIRAGIDRRVAARLVYPGGSFGNGAAMRIAPLGLFYNDDLQILKRAAEEASGITHIHPLGIEGAVIQAAAVAMAVRSGNGSPLDPKDFLEALRGLASQRVYIEKLHAIGRLLEEGANPGRVASELGNGVEAFNSVPTAIFSFLANRGSFQRAVLYAIGLGGDADTIGAMTGAISGAYVGAKGLPRSWLAKLESADRLERLALALFEAKYGRGR
ncbi:MAG: ADP-ribosylglycohydrolase family protein [Candidatus Bathyarchaeia archaeon]